MAAALLSSSFMHWYSYYTQHRKAICIHWAELWSGRRAIMQPHLLKVQALGNGSEKHNGSWHPQWILYYRVTASGVKSLRRAQQQAAERPLTTGMAHGAFNLLRQMCGRGVASQDLHWDIWENKWMTTDMWACALWSKKITFFVACLFWQHLRSSRIL